MADNKAPTLILRRFQFIHHRDQCGRHSPRVGQPAPGRTSHLEVCWRLALPTGQITLDRVCQAATEGEVAKIHRNSPHANCPVGRSIRQVLLGVYRQANEALDGELARISVADVLAAVLKEEKTTEAR